MKERLKYWTPVDVTMEFSDSEQIFLQRWQYLQQKSTDENISPHHRADYTRQLMEIPRFAAAEKLADLNDVDSLTRSLAER